MIDHSWNADNRRVFKKTGTQSFKEDNKQRFFVVRDNGMWVATMYAPNKEVAELRALVWFGVLGWVVRLQREKPVEKKDEDDSYRRRPGAVQIQF